MSLDVTLVDRSGPNDRAAYDVRYALDGTDAARTATVSVTVRDETTDTVTRNATGLAATAGTHTVAYDDQGTAGDRYTVTVRAHDGSDTVLDTETVADVADGADSDAAGTVSRADSPLSQVSLVDRTGPSGDGVAYTLGYEAADAVANVTVSLTPTANASKVARATTVTTPSGSVTYTTGSAGERYVASFVARNASGGVLDRYVLQDVADGRDTHDGFEPGARDAIRNVTLADRSTVSDGTQYAVSYATADSTQRVAVAFVDREATYAIRTGTHPANGSATYAERTYGDDYTIVVAALDGDGRVLDVRTLDDTADGEDGRNLGAVSRPGKPIRHLSVDDKSDGHYTVEATAGSGAARVEAMVMQDGSVAKAWTDATAGFDYYGSGGGRYAFTFLAYDADGSVVDAYVVTDVADGRDSAESYDTDRAVLSRVAVSDKSAKKAGKKSRYRVEYASNASRVDVVFHHPSNPGYGVESMLGLAPNGSATYPPSGSSYYTSGDEYVILVRALNDDGEVVDVEAVRDVADGTDPPTDAS
ncbi:hypothetical protein [Halarchaeum rubridurum]|uniref:hypothetical protein n=1 Tax=Halarchaeum rubridurum TaxID=489911 RepID=UPI0016656D4E|nr:hypothetical protein [Halarchaeum rubridurum]